MTPKYSPTVEVVRDAYHRWRYYADPRFRYSLEAFQEFDRWLSELIRKEREEAWDEGFDAHDEDWEHHEASGWGDEDCLDATYNPYWKEQP